MLRIYVRFTMQGAITARAMAIFQPHAPSHAIEQAVVGVRLLNDAGDASFAAAVQKAAELQAEFELPGRMQIDGMSLMFGRQALTMGYRTGSVELKPASVFQRVNADGSMACELSIERSAVTLRTRDYGRWADMERFIEGLLGPVASELCSGQFSKITAVELRCVDRFVAPNDPAPPLSAAVSTSSPLIPAYLYDKSEFLHSHTGWFENVTDQGRVLINLNVDVADDDCVRVINLLKVVSIQSSGIDPEFYGEGEFLEVLRSSMARAHDREKAILASLITSELALAIGLQGASGVSPL